MSSPFPVCESAYLRPPGVETVTVALVAGLNIA